jgi:hypothetical protein
MTAEAEKKIAEIVAQAVMVANPLKDLLEQTKTDPGAPFEAEMIAYLADLRRDDPASYQRLRGKLKKMSVSVRELDRLTTDRSGSVAAAGSNQAEMLIGLAEEAELFHTPDGTPYADVQVTGHRRTFEISEDSGFADWLRHRWFQATRNAPSPEALKSALRSIAAMAQQEGPKHEVYVRVAKYEGAFYLDLANDEGQAVKIGPAGWAVVKDPPVRFRRPPGMLAQPVPVAGGSVSEDLLPLLNLTRESDQVLVAHWLINGLLASPCYPVLVLQGEQGSGKSGTTRMLRTLIDPNSAPIRSLPRNERDLAISAINGHLLAFDNISALSAEMSDALCRLSTGTTLATRRLYTNSQEETLTAVRPIVLNGIEHFVTREDLADRAIFIVLDPIPKERRRTEEEVSAAFEERRPRILGALLSAAVQGLSRLPDLKPKQLSRMADFDKLAMACETAMWPAGTFEKAYDENREEVLEAGIEADPVAAAVISMLTPRGVRTVRTVRTMISKNDQRVISCYEWKGAAGDLLRDLSTIVDSMIVRGRCWPKTPRELAGRLRRVTPLLRHKGIEIEFRGAEGHANTRMIYITVKVSTLGETPFASFAWLASGVNVEIAEATEGSYDDLPPAEEEQVYDSDEASP